MQCDRSAYGGPTDEVKPYYEYLKRNYPTKKWYSGEKTIFQKPVAFVLLVWRESRMLQYFKLFLSSGIYHQVTRQVSLNATVFRGREDKVRKKGGFRYGTSFREVGLDDSIQTIFILLLTCLAGSFCLFSIEYIKQNRANIATIVTLVWEKYIKRVQKCRHLKKLRHKIMVQPKN